jgi:hypothetical protein
MPLSAQSESSEKKTAPAPLTELDKKFMETLSSSTLAGRWRLAKDGKLGDEREDKYTIGTVTKLGADLWVIGARIQYGGKDVTLPVPVKVFWAGDTPVISITNAGIPGLGTYTARVMVYGDYYTGTWSAPDHAGFLCGTILKEAKDIKETKSPKEPASEGDKKGDKQP